MKTLHFKSDEDYRKWNAYRFMHHTPKGNGYAKVIISKHLHKVNHGRK